MTARHAYALMLVQLILIASNY